MKKEVVTGKIQLVHVGKPISYNCKESTKIEDYRNQLTNNYHRHYKGKLVNPQLYGVVVHFFKVDRHIDADNLSKRVWDVLTGVAFDDDEQVKSRMAVSFDLQNVDYQIFGDDEFEDFNNPDLVYDLLSSMWSNDHTVYIECGNISTFKNVFKFCRLWK